jgi:hypothetical protein
LERFHNAPPSNSTPKIDIGHNCSVATNSLPARQQSE